MSNIEQRMLRELPYTRRMTSKQRHRVIEWVQSNANIRSIILTNCGPRKIDVIKIIRAYTGQGLKEAKDMAELTPTAICVDAGGRPLMHANLNDMYQELERVGASVEWRE